MKTDIQFVKATKDDNAARLVQEKLDKLGQKYSWVIRADVFFREEPDTDGKGKICEIRLSLPGPRLYVDSNQSSYEAAVAESVKDIEIQLDKRKNDMISH